MNKNSFIVVAYCCALFCSLSCADDDFVKRYGTKSGITVSVHDYKNESDITRSTLTPGGNGTSFAWEKGDIVAVYSAARGMTNFFIDESTISKDKSTANFYGSGFSLAPLNTYYAFYPYGRGQALDKRAVPVSYNYQKQDSNGGFNDLGNFDYMYASGVSDDNGHVGFTFNHLGCVVEYKITIPQSAVYNKVRLELESNDVSLIKKGVVDLTASTPQIMQNEEKRQDSILSVILNGTEGLALAKDSILTVYMMMAPQDLSGMKLTIRLVDINQNWYSASVDGKNMRAGYTYHYVIGQSGNGDFTGSGSGLPDDEELVLEYISSYTPAYSTNIEDFAYDGTYLYSSTSAGIMKLDFSNAQFPMLIGHNKLDTETRKTIRARGVAESGDYLYVSLRQNTGGITENIKPEIRLTFETNIDEFGLTETHLSNNETFNGFFKYLNISSVDAAGFDKVYIYKAFLKENGYRNSILFANSTSSMFMYGETYPTREEALSALTSYYKTSRGDVCKVDWSTVPEGANILYPISIDSDMSKGNYGISNKEICNLFFDELRLNSISPSAINGVYIYKAYLKSKGVYRNSILFTSENGRNVTFLGKSYATKTEALNDLSDEYVSSGGDYCRVNWDCITEPSNVITGLSITNLGAFDGYSRNGNANISETGLPCPNTGLYSACLTIDDNSTGNDYALLTRALDSYSQTAELSLWINLDVVTNEKEVYLPIIRQSDGSESSLIISPNSGNYSIGLKTSDGSTYSSNSFKMSEWYNLKIVFTPSNVSVHYREKECGDWKESLTASKYNSCEYQTLLLGIKSSNSNVKVYIDDYYYHHSNIDKVSYVNGNLITVEKGNMNTVRTYNLDLKGTDIYVHDNYLFHFCLKGFNVYDISIPSRPILKFTHRDENYTEYQGADFYENSGRNYMVVSNYSIGISIWDITNPETPICVAKKGFEGLTAEDGTALEGTGYGFDVKVDYPYVYSTWANNTQYMNTSFWHIGVLTYDISNLSSISMKLTEIPLSDRYDITTDGDKRPTRITIYNNHLILNNSNKGIVMFGVNDPASPVYEGQFDIDGGESVNPVFATADGSLFLGDKKIHLLKIIK